LHFKRIIDDKTQTFRCRRNKVDIMIIKLLKLHVNKKIMIIFKKIKVEFNVHVRVRMLFFKREMIIVIGDRDGLIKHVNEHCDKLLSVNYTFIIEIHIYKD